MGASSLELCSNSSLVCFSPIRVDCREDGAIAFAFVLADKDEAFFDFNEAVLGVFVEQTMGCCNVIPVLRCSYLILETHLLHVGTCTPFTHG